MFGGALKEKQWQRSSGCSAINPIFYPNNGIKINHSAWRISGSASVWEEFPKSLPLHQLPALFAQVDAGDLRCFYLLLNNWFKRHEIWPVLTPRGLFGLLHVVLVLYGRLSLPELEISSNRSRHCWRGAKVQMLRWDWRALSLKTVHPAFYVSLSKSSLRPGIV